MADLLIAQPSTSSNIPNFTLASQIYKYEVSLEEEAEDVGLKETILSTIKDKAMAPLYTQLCAQFNWNVDEDLHKSLLEQNDTDLKKIETTYEDAVQNLGDTEILDALFSKARHYAAIGNFEEAYKVYDVILAKEKTTTGKKIDATFDKYRVALFANDTPRLSALLTSVKSLIESGGDWDRRNRYKIYDAFYLMKCRDIRKASELLLDCVATFNCSELCDYDEFMFYLLLTSLISLPRTVLKEKVIQNPHVITVLRDHPRLDKFLNSFYKSEYHVFFATILELYPEIKSNRYLGPHVTYLLREYRVIAYSQYLQSYRSVMLSTMASSFGIPPSFLDQELSKFIAAGRLTAKINKVGDTIVTSRPDKKNRQYQEVIKKGDLVLNQIQKLSRVIQM